jgi:hypothetical protein
MFHAFDFALAVAVALQRGRLQPRHPERSEGPLFAFDFAVAFV